MGLSPEERRRIYEEEKARIEAREQIEREKSGFPGPTSTGLEPNVAGLLCYVGAWVSGLVFFLIEDKNRWVRFHAAQSIVVFGTVTVVGSVLGLIPVVGGALSAIVGIIGFILWIVLMVKAYGGRRYKLPWAGDIAERMIGPGVASDYATAEPTPAPHGAEGEGRPSPASQPARPSAGRRVDGQFEARRAGRITGYVFAIAWSIALLVFFNFFNEYVAYYSSRTVAGVSVWDRFPLLTGEFGSWLPILDATLAVSIVAYVALIVYDRYVFRQSMRVVIDILGFATVVSLLSIFPFDFAVIPDAGAADITQLAVTAALVFVSAAMGIGILTRAIQLLVSMARGTVAQR